MKKLLLLAITAIFCFQAFAQNCPYPQNHAWMDINNIKARMSLGGDFFTDGTNGHFIPNWQTDTNALPTISRAGIWLSALDPAGNLKISTTTYAGDVTDFAAGPLDSEGIPVPGGCSNWDRLFVVNKSDIQAFRNLPASTTLAEKIQQFPTIMGWPGTGNPFFEQINGFGLPAENLPLAPFNDLDHNGLYNPANGEYPVVIQHWIWPPFLPDQLMWGVINDVNSGTIPTVNPFPLNAEVQMTAWAFNCPDQPVINNTIFTSYKVISRNEDPLDSLYFSIWTDFTLGCSKDDFVGCSDSKNTFYVYNDGVIDGQSAACDGQPALSNGVPVQSVTFLETGLAHFMAIPAVGPAVMLMPELPAEYFNYMTGTWRDGTPLTYGGNGYNTTSSDITTHMYPSLPDDPDGWSACTANVAPNHWRTVGSSHLWHIEPGAYHEIPVAWTVHPPSNQPCSVGSTLADIDVLQNWYNNSFYGCGSLTDATEPAISKLAVYPNPTSADCTIEYGNAKAISLRIISADGRLVRVFEALPSGHFLVPVEGLVPGNYVLWLLTEEGVMTNRIQKN